MYGAGKTEGRTLPRFMTSTDRMNGRRYAGGCLLGQASCFAVAPPPPDAFEGPYKLEQVEASLREMNTPGAPPHPEDGRHSSCNSTSRRPTTTDPELFKKVNRSIGTTVQPTYYRERLHEAATGTEDTKQEVRRI